MIGFFFSFALCHPPIILVPGMADSQLSLGYDIEHPKYWFCPKHADPKTTFVDIPTFLPPNMFCIYDLARLLYNETTDRVESQPGTNFEPVDFGGQKGIQNVVSLPFGFTMLPVYKKIIKKLEKVGYVIGRDLFGMPYDWRLGICLHDEFWDKMVNLIEKAVDENESGKSGVTIIAHSFGSVLINEILTKRTTQEWRKKYIKRIIFVAPAFGGFGWSVRSLWMNELYPFLKIKPFMPTFAGFMSLLPNFEIFGNETIIITPEGENLTAKDVPDFLEKHGKVDPKILQKATKNIKNTPIEPDVEKFIVYNSAIQSNSGMKMKNYESRPSFLTLEGDGSLPKIGIEWACNHWTNISCYDLKHPKISHEKLLLDDNSISLIFQLALDLKHTSSDSNIKEL
ncbi:Lecithin:cholesterol acyltransferase family protein [Tritrichomonas foetus]|uniref:Lecithin:cholesterol acyltransferase family protein n=1 Tax=Tritrichomonas foetus TaxID=1144522 RepID=A0A1J4KYS5_9EUKA|nr:Lecithin:cholesterol acyltransferase family protein [Tritrichomonas foetus]|eukprot:OHT16403.1 Lecithin:cholesterol acyltransferase family protein [Tritrichomonas foetus]